MLKRLGQGQVLPFTLALVAALGIGAVIVAISGANPVTAYWSGVQTAVGTPYRLLNTLTNTTVLLLTGLACAIAFRSGVWNIGVEGQLYLGGFCAALTGLIPGVPPAAHILLVIMASIAAGAFWAFIPGALRVWRGTNEIVVTLMLNYVAIQLTSYLVNYPFRAAGSAWPATATTQASAQLPYLYPLSRFNGTFFIALAFLALVLVVISYTKVGYEWKMVGLNSRAAVLGGIEGPRAMLLAMLLSGALAGLAGGLEVIGVRHCFMDAFSPGFGMTGLLIALVAQNDPRRVALVAFLFAFLKSSAAGMELSTNVPAELSEILQTVLVLFLAAAAGLAPLMKNAFAGRNSRG